jgi:hypothetical protein
MATKSFGREFAEEVFCKALTLAAPIAAGIILSPAGIAIGAAAAVAIVASSKIGGGSASNASQSKETGSST